MTRVHIACSARNAGRYLDELMESLVAQTHGDWALWIRDDGSSDDTWSRIEQWRAREPRIVWCERGEESLGSARAFGRVLAQLPRDAVAIATADADDVWMPHRLERTLAALSAASAEQGGAVLVHTDLTVVDSELKVLAPSFWRSEGIDPTNCTVPSLAIQNVAIGPTLLFNGELLAELREIPHEAKHQDWWIALVAAATGRLVSVAEPTVWYRQHGANTAGARTASPWARLVGAYAARDKVMRDLDRTALQAGALVSQYGTRLSAADREALLGLASIASKKGWPRRLAIARWRWLGAHGVLRNLGVVLRG
jgi:glycosyltransferase involved in cell wall biosynthesis